MKLTPTLLNSLFSFSVPPHHIPSLPWRGHTLLAPTQLLDTGDLSNFPPNNVKVPESVFSPEKIELGRKQENGQN